MLYNLNSVITLLWIPSHCDIPGNEQADELANKRSMKNQENFPITHSILKANIKGKKWEPTHERARATFGEKRSPKMEIERIWPKKVRTLYSRLRTRHTTELKAYKARVNREENRMCESGCGEEETIEHVLCHGGSLEEAHVR